MKIYTREELEELSGADIKDILRDKNISFSIKNRKADNIEILLNSQKTNIDSTNSNENLNLDEVCATKEEVIETEVCSLSNDINCKLDLNKLQSIYDDFRIRGNINELDDVDISQAFIYEKSPITYKDEFLIETKMKFYEGLILIVNSEDELVAKGNLIKSNQGYYITVLSKDIMYNKLIENTRYNVIFFDEKAKSYLESNKTSYEICKGEYDVYKESCRIIYKEMDKTSKPLCIDFGTSNTTLGSYGILDEIENEIELVEFINYANDSYEKTSVYPTLVYVKDCSSENIEYLFGYEAKKKIIEQDYDTKASTFLEIKRWINDLDYIEEIFDEKERCRKVSRREILKSYIMHVLDLAEQHFKKKFVNLHFSAPIKLKDKFNSEMKVLLSEYTVMGTTSSLDEGISIIYNHISNIMKTGYYTDKNENTSVMIIDCGGGTTDLASCNYSFDKNETGYDLRIKTKFENGDSNFGGNNITYRILQFLKIKLASAINDNMISEINELIPFNENDTLEIIDKAKEENKKVTIYSKLEEQYKLAEDVIPTGFGDTKKYRGEKKQRNIKRNFYYLWQLAEKIKIEFYKRTDLLSINFLEDKGESKNIILKEETTFYLYTINKETGMLERQDEIPDISINIKEITNLLYADIYTLLNNVLGDTEIQKYKNYKLSGQSCKITLFNQLLKEFVPGKSLRSSNSGENSEKLKLECIRGSIAYIKDKQSGRINPVITSEKPKIIYDVYINRGERKEILNGQHLNIEVEFFKNTASIINLEVYDAQKNLEQKIEYDIRFENNNRVTLHDIEQSILEKDTLEKGTVSKIIDNIRNIIVEDVVISIFIVPAKDNYGFYIYQVGKKNLEDGYAYLMSKPIYKNFEANISSETFFDGSR